MINLSASYLLAKWAGAACAMAALTYVQPYRPMVVVGRSMEPTYGNHSVVMTEPIRPDQIKDGQVVVIDMDYGPIVKRIAFAPGDKFLQIHFDNEWVDLVYVHPTSQKSIRKAEWRQYTIPPGMVYVLGDNQEVSYD